MATINELSKIFIALQNRAIDQSIVTQYNSQPVPQVIIAAIGNNNVAYTTNPRNFIEMVYKNLLGKNPADDVEGINYWVNKMTQSENNPTALTPAQALEEIIKEVQRYDDAIAAGQATITVIGADGKEMQKSISTVDIAALKVFDTKVQISMNTAEKVGEVDAFYLTFGSGLSEVTKENAETVLETINNEVTSVAERYPAAVPGQSGALTVDNPNFNASNGATSGDDTVVAVVDGANSTLKGESVIDALEGNDTLKVQMKGDFNGLTASGSITNVENIELTNATSGTLTFNAKGIEGVRTYSINGDTNGNSVNLTDIAYQNNLEIRLNNVKNTDGTTVGFDADNAPTNGSLSVRLNKVGTKDATHNVNFDGVSNVQVYLAGGNNYANFMGSNLSKVSLGGSGDFTTKLGSTVTYFNAANATGNLTIDASTDQSTTQTQKLENLTTGAGKDNVTVDVSRLGKNAIIDLGAGDDTLKLTGQVSDTTTQYYDISSVESLTLNINNSGSLNLDVGTSRYDDFGNATATNDRSASLKSVTVEDKASADIKGLGNKNLNISYKGTDANQSISLDHAGTTNLTFNTKALGAGKINLANSTILNVNIDGEGFSGTLDAAKATELSINNSTANKVFKTTNSDLESLATLKINTESQGSNNDSGVSLYGKLNALSNVSLTGKGSVALDAINSAGLSIDGNNHSGMLTTGNINVKQGSLNIVTKGTVSLGQISGGSVTLDLKGSDASNKVGDITLTGSSSTLTYTTGSKGITQNVSLAGTRGTLTLNGQEAIDRFNVKVTSNTESLTLSGDLGAGSNAVTVDLSDSTKGVKFDAGRLNTGESGKLNITASDGKDTITLARNLNKDSISFEAGIAQGTAQEEVATVTFADMLTTGQSLKFGNAELIVTGASAAGTDIARAVAEVLDTGKLSATSQGIFSLEFAEGTNAFEHESFDASVWNKPQVSGNTVTFTSKQKDNVENLNFDFKVESAGGNPATATANVTKPVSNVESGAGSDVTAGVTPGTVSGTTEKEYTLSGTGLTDNKSYVIKIANSGTNAVTASNVAKTIAAVVNNKVDEIPAGVTAYVKASDGNYGAALTNSSSDNGINQNLLDANGNWTLAQADTSTNANKLKIAPANNNVMTASPTGVQITSGSDNTVAIPAGVPKGNQEKIYTVSGLENGETYNVQVTNAGSSEITVANIATILSSVITGTFSAGDIPANVTVKLSQTNDFTNSQSLDNTSTHNKLGTGGNSGKNLLSEAGNWTLAVDSTNKIKMTVKSSGESTVNEIPPQGLTVKGDGGAVIGVPPGKAKDTTEKEYTISVTPSGGNKKDYFIKIINTDTSAAVGATAVANIVKQVINNEATTSIPATAKVYIKEGTTGVYGQALTSSSQNNGLDGTGKAILSSDQQLEVDDSGNAGKLKLSTGATDTVTFSDDGTNTDENVPNDAYSSNTIAQTAAGSGNAATATAASSAMDVPVPEAQANAAAGNASDNPVVQTGAATNTYEYYYKIEGLKTSGTGEADFVEVKIVSDTNTGNATQIAKVLAAVIEGSQASGANNITGLTNIKSVGDAKDPSKTITVTGGTLDLSSAGLADLTGAGWTMSGENGGVLQLSPTATSGLSAPNYGMTIKVSAGNDGSTYTEISGAGFTVSGISNVAKVDVTFQDLKEGQWHKLDGVTLIAKEDLAAAAVAEAYAKLLANPDDATVLQNFIKAGTFTNLKSADFSATTNGGVVTYSHKNPSGATVGATLDAIEASLESGGSTGSQQYMFTTTDGNNGAAVDSYSYVTLKDANTAPDESHLDTITNFNVGQDSITVTTKGATKDLTPLADTTMNGLEIKNGVVTGFGNLNSLAQKFDALKNIAQDEVVGFADGNNFYVVVGGHDDTTIGADDVVVKLAGVSSVNNILDVL